MENKAHALAAGLFLLLLGGVLAAAVVWFRGDHVQRVSYTVVARAGVPGLALKAPVRLRGVDVGSVEAIAFDPRDARRILVRIAVDSQAPLTRGTYAQLGYQGVTGLSFIDLSDRGDDPRPLAALAEAQRELDLRPSLLDQLATSGPALLAAFAETAERLNTLLAPQNQQRLVKLLETGERTLDGVGRRVDELRPAVAALPTAIRRIEGAAARADGALQRADGMVQRADGTLQRIDTLAEQSTAVAVDLRARLPVLDRAGDAARRVESAVRAIELGLVGADATSSPPLVGTLVGTARSVDRTAGLWADHPQSLVLGRTPARPGPGEAGFDAGAQGAR